MSPLLHGYPSRWLLEYLYREGSVKFVALCIHVAPLSSCFFFPPSFVSNRQMLEIERKKKCKWIKLIVFLLWFSRINLFIHICRKWKRTRRNWNETSWNYLLKNSVCYFLFATIRDFICVLNSRTRFRGYRGNNCELNKIRSRERNLKISPEISWREKFYFGSFVRDPLQRGFRKWSSSRTRYL